MFNKNNHGLEMKPVSCQCFVNKHFNDSFKLVFKRLFYVVRLISASL